jgi:hypothetical protein
MKACLVIIESLFAQCGHAEEFVIFGLVLKKIMKIS